MKKHLAQILFAVLVVSLLAACGSDALPASGSELQSAESATLSAADPTEEAANEVPAAPEPETPDSALEPSEASAEEATAAETPKEPAYSIPLCEETETLTYWITMPPPATMVITDMSEVLAYSEAEARTNVHIEFTSASEFVAAENFNLLVAANSYPDLLLNVDEYYAGGAIKAYADEVIIDLGDLIETYADNYKAILNGDEGLKRDVITDDGNMLSFWTIDNEAAGARGPLIRQDWLDQLGLDVPETYEDYHKTLLAFKNEIGCESPLNMSAYGYDSSGYLAAGYGISLVTPFFVENGTVKFAYLQDGCLDYITMMHQWYEDGIFSSDYLNNPGRYSAPEEPVVLGKSGLTYISTNQIDSLFDASSDPGFDLSAITDATKEPGETLHFGDLPDSRAEESGTSISVNCEKPDLAACWLDYFYGEEGALLANYGVEGVSYEIVDGMPTYTDVITNSETGFDSSLIQFAYLFNQGAYYKDARRLFCIFSDMVLGCYDVWESNLDQDRWEMPASVSLTVDETSEFAALYSDIYTLCSEYLNRFIIGDLALSEYNGFKESLQQMGIDRCVELYQAAYERYESRK